MFDCTGITCPHDALPLKNIEGQLRCENGHSFDLAKQGYCNLLPVQAKRSRDPGDSKAMIAARSELLDSGVYQGIADKLCELVAELGTGKSLAIADAGCGEGYYLKALESHLQQADLAARMIGFDISKWAVARACKRSRSVSWLVASSKQPPLADRSLDLILCMFGYTQYPQFASKLTQGGHLLLVDAGPDHLLELRRNIYQEIKPHRNFDTAQAEQAGFELISTHSLRQQVTLNQAQLQQLMLMTPHFFRAKAEAKQQLAELEELTLTLDVEYRLFRCM
ncbi:putative RNA methyltransferase [Dongshaea marina]|uniref:putative RNA methyltransferase n=1 Tax=Dongshaea marina TaxID=2047966 RepID=UPI000D3E1467|nr:methyltransferase domain-containing protein [Dongshaea marina]